MIRVTTADPKVLDYANGTETKLEDGVLTVYDANKVAIAQFAPVRWWYWELDPSGP